MAKLIYNGKVVGGSIQLSALPSPAIEYIEKIYQYVGQTNSTFTNGYFYKCELNENNEYEWKEVSVSKGGEASDIDYNNAVSELTASNVQEAIDEINTKAEAAVSSKPVLTEDIEPNIEVGGINVGDTLTEGQEITDVLKKLLVKYFKPVITLITDKALINKKGSVVNSPITIVATAEKKSDDITTYSINYNGNTVSTGNNAEGGEITYIHQTNISTDTIFTGSVTDGKNTVNETIKFEFINPYYYGSVNDNEISDFTGLTEETVKKNINKKVSYTSSAEHLVFAYDATYGDLTSIKDKNNFENLPAFTKTVMEVNGENYNVYISSDKITCNNFEYTFKI